MKRKTKFESKREKLIGKEFLIFERNASGYVQTEIRFKLIDFSPFLTDSNRPSKVDFMFTIHCDRCKYLGTTIKSATHHVWNYAIYEIKNKIKYILKTYYNINISLLISHKCILKRKQIKINENSSH